MTVKRILWILTANFLLILGQLFIPVVSEIFSGTILFLAPFVTFFLLGTALTVLTIKKKVKGRLRKYLMLAGISSAGFFISVVLHNALYALEIITQHITILSSLLGILHVAFFLIAIFSYLF